MKFFFHDVNKHNGVIKVLKIIKNKEIPSTPNEIRNLLANDKKRELS